MTCRFYASGERLDGAKVFVVRDLRDLSGPTFWQCGKVEGKHHAKVIVNCGVRGRYVKIKHTRKEILTLCEVEVYRYRKYLRKVPFIVFNVYI